MLSGQVFDRDEESLHVDVQGVGYQVYVPKTLLADFATGQQTRLRIYTHVREDLIQLFGFESKVQEQLFRSLIKVNGVGPKVAVGILSSASTEQFRDLIRSKDVKGLSRLPKIGKKTAEQILLKLGDLDWQPPSNAEALETPVSKKLRLALVNLGFSADAVNDVVMGLDREASFEENFRTSLSQLSRI